MFTCVPGRYVAFMVLLVPKPLGGADSIGGQLCGDRESPFSGVTSSGRVWREVPESDALSVHRTRVASSVFHCHLIFCLEVHKCSSQRLV